MSPRAPLVSVVIAVYNGERYLDDALASVRDQTWDNLECIVVDDGSTDGTATVVREHAAADQRVRLIQQSNRGVSAARNHGISLARGELIAFLDADDVWLSTKLARQVDLAGRRPEVGLIFCGYAIVDEHLRERSVVRPDPRSFDMLGWLLLEGDGMGLAFTGMVPTSVIAEAGGFDESLSTSADLDFAFRIASRWPVDAVDEPLSLYRTHRAQMHLEMGPFERDVLRIYERNFGEAGSFAVLRRRGTANLYTRLFWMAVRNGDATGAVSAFRGAVEQQPSRLVVLPASALIRRARRLARTWRRRLVGTAAKPGRIG